MATLVSDNVPEAAITVRCRGRDVCLATDHEAGWPRTGRHGHD
jgi:hypothetical protein